MNPLLRWASKHCLSALGRLEVSVAHKPSPPRDPDAVRNILIWSMDRLGDIVRATPAIRMLKHRFASASITVVATGRAAPALLQNPWISSLHHVPNPYDLRRHLQILRAFRMTRWDMGVLLEVDPYWSYVGRWWFWLLGVKHWAGFHFGSRLPRTAIATSLNQASSWVDHFVRLAASLGAEDDGRGLEIHVSAEERVAAEQLLRANHVEPTEPFIVVHAGGTFLTLSRQWPPESFAGLVTLLRRDWGYPIVVVGSNAERGTIETIKRHTRVELIDLSGKTDIRQLAAVIDLSRLCIMNDSGPLHIAHALRKAAVAILGPTAPAVVGIPSTTIVVRADLPCSPCAFLGGWRTCTNPVEWECLNVVTPDHVFAAVREQIKRTGPPLAIRG